jgi:hypothetical protein
MAVMGSEIEAVRVMGEDGEYTPYAWKPSSWYGIRDDRPYLDILIRGYAAQSVDKTKLEKLTDPAPDGARWQRWNFEQEIARDRRFGEISLRLKVPEDVVLRCYVVPTALLSYRDVIAMIEDIEFELGVNATWDVADRRPDRSWSRRGSSGSHVAVRELIRNIEDELRFAHAIRRDPFSELGPRSRRHVPLQENAIVSHWAMKRHDLLQRSGDKVAEELQLLNERSILHNPAGRLPELHNSIERLEGLTLRISELKGMLSRLCKDNELQTSIYPGPIFQRDHRLRHLLCAFAPRLSEALSTAESARSHYPPIYLNTLWELWGAVWLAKEFRRWGFAGSCFLNPVDKLHSCSWRLQRGDVVLELDYEAHPTFIDYANIPPVHQRGMPALEWAAMNQRFDQTRPFFGSEEKSSPDYLIRITTPAGRNLMVGDACLASPQHHGVKKPQDAKPYTVENYRQSVGWVTQGQVVRCHPMGGFVLFPPPSESWDHLQQLPGVRDCTLLSPSPPGDEAASKTLANLLIAISPGVAVRPT